MFAPSINVDLEKLAQPEETKAQPAKKVAAKGVKSRKGTASGKK